MKLYLGYGPNIENARIQALGSLANVTVNSPADCEQAAYEAGKYVIAVIAGHSIVNALIHAAGGIAPEDT